MGRDNKQGKSSGKGSLPQTPKNEKIAPAKVQEEISKELGDFSKITPKNIKK